MTSSEKRKLILRDSLISAAQELIAEVGVEKVTARAIASKAGCGLGTIYNAYPDLRSLFMEVNARTHDKIEIAFEKVIPEVRGKSPIDKLIALSIAYVAFAKENTHLWRAMFDFNVHDMEEIPESYGSSIDKMFSYIEIQVAALMPDLDDQGRFLMTRALYSSVHGIMYLGIENRISGISFNQIEAMIIAVLTRLGESEQRSK